MSSGDTARYASSASFAIDTQESAAALQMRCIVWSQCSFPASASCLPLPCPPSLSLFGQVRHVVLFLTRIQAKPRPPTPTPTFAPLSWLCCGEGVPHIFNSLQPGRSFGILPLDPSVLARPTEADVHICRTHSQPRRVSMTDTSTLETCCARLLRCTSQKHNYPHTVPYSALHIRSELIGNDKLNLISY